MANYLVTDTDLTSVADAIRTKGGTSAQLAFPDGFVDAVEAIETGGGSDYLAEQLNNTLISYQSANVTSVPESAFNGRSRLAHIDLPNVTLLGQNAFLNCTALAGNIQFPRLADLKQYALRNTAVESVEMPSVISIGWSGVFRNNSHLKRVLIGSSNVNLGNSYTIGPDWFQNCTDLNVLILGWTNKIAALNNISAFNSTPFASGGAGGTLYVPQSMLSTYQAATNWSTILAYDNNNILPIEGSIYE